MTDQPKENRVRVDFRLRPEVRHILTTVAAHRVPKVSQTEIIETLILTLSAEAAIYRHIHDAAN